MCMTVGVPVVFVMFVPGLFIVFVVIMTVVGLGMLSHTVQNCTLLLVLKDPRHLAVVYTRRSYP